MTHNNILDNSLIQSTFFLKYGASAGTCFTYTHNDKQYLITARHITDNKNSGDQIRVEILHDKQWKYIDGTVHLHENKNIDIAVINIGTDIAPRFKLNIGAKMGLGMDLFFLGFPYGLHQESGNINRDFPLPFVKKGVFSAVCNTPETGTIFYLDGHNNKGFSGGPVGHYNLDEKKSYIHGVISGYIPQKGEINTPTGKLFYDENSGIVLVYSIKHAIEIIEKILMSPTQTIS